MKYVLHRDTGTLVAVNECEIVDDTNWTEDEAEEVTNGGDVPDTVTGVSLSSVLEKLA